MHLRKRKAAATAAATVAATVSRTGKRAKVDVKNEVEVSSALTSSRAQKLTQDVSYAQVMEAIKPQVKLEPEPEANLDSPRVKVEAEVEGEEEEQDLPPNIFSKVDPADAATGPSNWSTIYNEVVEMRSKFMAPVDHQGCESMPNTITPNLQKTNPQKYRFQLLISLMLSSQTKDEVNYDAMSKLNTALSQLYPEFGFSLQSVSKLTPGEIDSYISKVGFHNRKSNYIHQACQILIQEHKGDIPRTIEEIVKLPGVGPKMGYLLLQCGWGINSGIGVDVHLHRLASMWGWISRKANTPEKCRAELESWLPSRYWTDINPLVVGFGQVVCVPRAPNCDICSLGRTGVCKSANKKLVNSTISDERRAKLMKQRADLTNLINEL
ncbi:uncharacterized protein LODBEIA_P04440 [Lodderomyces beijingensis]|uniref:Endonuclease III homolog n=1 Tax=Lodderomyces beijingensis TaxID=1775926 RepID=A0ABP0ZDG5_9ASCO